jgi:hypothetical protein
MNLMEVRKRLPAAKGRDDCVDTSKQFHRSPGVLSARKYSGAAEPGPANAWASTAGTASPCLEGFPLCGASLSQDKGQPEPIGWHNEEGQNRQT